MTPKALEDYKRALGEIKLRIEAVDQVLSHAFPNMRQRIGVELCYLQFRLICEIVAIGSLFLHGGLIKERRDKLLSSSKADWIMKELAKLNPKFFPSPVIRNEGPVLSFTPLSDGYMTRGELIDLSNRIVGGELHRGGAEGIMERNLSIDFETIATIRNKLVTLLACHTVISADEQTLVHAVMDDGTGQVKVWGFGLNPEESSAPHEDH